MIGIGALGLGSVFMGSYKPQVDRLTRHGRVQLRAAFDIDPAKVRRVSEPLGLTECTSAEELIARDDVDLVLVLTSMQEHGRLALAALAAGKHVLVEKPMATSLPLAGELVSAARAGRSQLVCAPHVLLAPTYMEMWRRVHRGDIGELHLGRARYGWSGPWWGPWFYKAGGGSLFDLGAYNLTALCGFFGSVRRVTAFMGTRIPQRIVDGQPTDVEVDDNVQILLDHGDARFSSVVTGFTIQRYRSPAIELYGASGSMNMLGHDWAPEGWEQWRNEAGCWESFIETHPNWHWTSGFEHLIDQLERGKPTITRPEQAYHVTEVMLAAMQSSAEGRVIEIHSEFPQPDYSLHKETTLSERYLHDPREVD